VFAHRRPDHLRRVFDALVRNKGFDESKIFVYSDGAKNEVDEDDVALVRSLVSGLRFPNVKLIESPGNKGLVRSIHDGVTELIEDFGRVIVLEDDLVVGRYFLSFMNTGLDRYCDCERVVQVCGFTFSNAAVHQYDALFVPMASSWGWATWKRTWDRFNATDMSAGLAELRQSAPLRRSFDLDGRYPMYLTLRRSAAGRTESWAIWLQLYTFLSGGLALWPASSLVRNIGNDGSGVHSRWTRRRSPEGACELADRPLSSFPEQVDVDPAAWEQVRRAVAAANPASFRLLSAWTGRFP
jgi:hypothetical protein